MKENLINSKVNIKTKTLNLELKWKKIQGFCFNNIYLSVSFAALKKLKGSGGFCFCFF